MSTLSNQIMEFIYVLHQWLAPFQHEIIYFSYTALFFGVLQNIIYLIQIPLAFSEIITTKLQKREQHNWWLVTSDITLPISILIAAYNEELTIVDTVRSILATQYPSFEVIIVNDGSKDQTMKVLIESFDMHPVERFYETKLKHQKIKTIYGSDIYPNLVVVDKENGGRSDALNAAIDISRNPIFCTLDADSMLDPHALLEAIQPFIEKPQSMVASGGTIRIVNGCKVENGVVTQFNLPSKIIPLFQIIEYIRAFLMGRMAYSKLKIVTIISGAFALFKRDIAVKAGGFSVGTIGEDLELVIRIHKHCHDANKKYEMCFIPEPVCWTECPEDLNVLRSQRIRWQQGALEVFFRHFNMFCNPKYGRIGMIAFPLMFIFDILGPIMELLGYILFPIFYLLGIIDGKFMLAFLSVFFVFGVLISMMSLILEEISAKKFPRTRDLMKMGLMAIIENFGYRQYNSIWRITGWWRFLRGKQSWGNMTRIGRK